MFVSFKELCEGIEEIRWFVKANSTNLLALAQTFHIDIDENQLSNYELSEVNSQDINIKIRDTQKNITYNGYLDVNFNIKNQSKYKTGTSRVESLFNNFSLFDRLLEEDDLPYVVFVVEYEIEDLLVVKEYSVNELYGLNYSRYNILMVCNDVPDCPRNLFVQITSAKERKIKILITSCYGVPVLSLEYSFDSQTVKNLARCGHFKFYSEFGYSPNPNGKVIYINGGDIECWDRPYSFSFRNNDSVVFEFIFPRYEFSYIIHNRKYIVIKNCENFEFYKDIDDVKTQLFTFKSTSNSCYTTKEDVEQLINELSAYRDTRPRDNIADIQRIKECIDALKICLESLNENNKNQNPTWSEDSIFSYVNYVGKTDDEILDFLIENKKKLFDKKFTISPSINKLFGTPIWGR